MIVRCGYKTYEEAATDARALLWEYRGEDALTTTEEHTRKDDKGDILPISYIEDKATGATAYIYSLWDGDSFEITFLTGEEASENNRTYPCRGISKDAILFLIALGSLIFKPVKEINPDEVFTPDGMKEIGSFFGEEGETAYVDFITEAEVARRGYTIETAFGEDYNELLCLPLPKVLTKLTGAKVKNASDYVRGISLLLKAELSEEQKKEVEESFLFNASFLFLRYATYEFFRTEDYNHLTEVLTTYKSFYLPKNWAERFICLRRDDTIRHISAEEYVLYHYLSKRGASLVGKQIRLKDVAEFTNTPLSLMNRVYRIKSFDLL